MIVYLIYINKLLKDIDCKVIISCNRKNKPLNTQFYFCKSINQHELFKKNGPNNSVWWSGNNF